MNTFFLALILVLGISLTVYLLAYFLIWSIVSQSEKRVISVFLWKVNKIPALIEVMRPYVVDSNAFSSLVSLHSEVMIYRHDSIYDLLEYNAKIQNQFLFLMKLSVHIPELQKHEYFLYIRDFIIKYDREMVQYFIQFNQHAKTWNRFVFIKNSTLLGFLLPWLRKEEISQR